MDIWYNVTWTVGIIYGTRPIDIMYVTRTVCITTESMVGFGKEVHRVTGM